jgi:hypothetical protein
MRGVQGGLTYPEIFQVPQIDLDKRIASQNGRKTENWTIHLCFRRQDLVLLWIWLTRLRVHLRRGLLIRLRSLREGMVNRERMKEKVVGYFEFDLDDKVGRCDWKS